MTSVVLIQISVLLLLGVFAFFYRYRTVGEVPLDDIGIFWILFFVLYTTLPGLFWLLQGGEYLVINKRLYNLGTTPEDMVYLLNISWIYLAFFILGFYCLPKSGNLKSPIQRQDIKNSLMFAALVVIFINASINIFFGSFSIIPKADSYAESYAIGNNLPLGIRQISKIFSGFDFTAWIIINIGLFQKYKKTKLLILILALIFLILNIGGARSPLFFYFFILLVLRHIFVSPISLRFFIFTGIASIALFLLLGIVRGLSGDILITGVGEFDMLWGNAVELLHKKQDSGIDVPLSIRFSDFFGFIPSQLLWFEKSTLSVWFMQEFYPIYIELGVGFSFGIISEIIIGNGYIDAIWRGFLLGLICSALMKFFQRESCPWWFLPFQLLLLVNIVLSIRDTSFRLIIDSLQIYLPSLLFIYILSRILLVPFMLKHKN